MGASHVASAISALIQECAEPWKHNRESAATILESVLCFIAKILIDWVAHPANEFMVECVLFFVGLGTVLLSIYLYAQPCRLPWCDPPA